MRIIVLLITDTKAGKEFYGPDVVKDVYIHFNLICKVNTS